MTIDTTKPEDTETLDMLPYWIRTLASAISGSTLDYTNVTIGAADTEITGADVFFEVIRLSATAAASPHTLTNGEAGRIKIILVNDGNTELVDGTGNLTLHGDPSAPDFPMDAGDIIAFLFDPRTNAWTEMFRSIN